MLIYSTNEAAQKLGLSPDHVRRLVRDGEIKGKKLGHDWVVLSLDYKRKRRPKTTKGESNAKS
jgi:excisionase family DNA binding protein